MSLTGRAYRCRVAGRRLVRPIFSFAAVGLLSTVPLVACSDDSSDSQVDASAAITAVVDWQAAQWVPPPEADENALPVIYVVAADGGEIGVSVQASVTEATVDEAIVRFADKPGDAFDHDEDGSPVHDDGVMLAIGPIPEPSRRVKLNVDRYEVADRPEKLALQIAARTPTDDIPRRAEVTATTPRS